MAHAWMPGARRIRADTDGGPLNGGAPRAVWLTLGTAPRTVSIQSAAQRLVGECRPCHLVWDPVTGDIVQLVSILRAGRALGTPEQLDWDPDRVPASPRNVNAEGRVCAQIAVLGYPEEPFTDGPMTGVDAIVEWLDSWGVSRRWPAGEPMSCLATGAERSRALWARGGHFGASQVPGCENAGPGAIDTDQLTGPHVLQVHSREFPDQLAAAAALAIPALALPGGPA
ncbi:hypothetical protein [Trebonia sp.]|uniref:hypothetical protein n=1 Tax=Trebonia sp. TaxID=2767075 RepID=UPI003CC66F8F